MRPRGDLQLPAMPVGPRVCLRLRSRGDSLPMLGEATREQRPHQMQTHTCERRGGLTATARPPAGPAEHFLLYLTRPGTPTANGGPPTREGHV